MSITQPHSTTVAVAGTDPLPSGGAPLPPEKIPQATTETTSSRNDGGRRNTKLDLLTLSTNVNYEYDDSNVMIRANRPQLAATNYHYDANGDITAMMVANQDIVARYEYGPFGEVIRATGPMAKLNPFMFSTKFYDWETGLYYFGYRFYNPSTGRFLNRDPIKEAGCVNLYAFVFNTPPNAIDFLGLDGHTGSIEMFLDFWAGNNKGAGLSKGLTDEVMNNQTIVDFGNSVFRRAALSMKCAKSGSVADHIKLDDFNPNWTWILSGNWQLSMSARADWSCKSASDWSGGQGAKPCNCCWCNIKLELVGSISKLYTFFYHPGGNPANILTELPAIIGQGFGVAEEYNVFQKLSQTDNWPAAHCDK